MKNPRNRIIAWIAAGYMLLSLGFVIARSTLCTKVGGHYYRTGTQPDTAISPADPPPGASGIQAEPELRTPGIDSTGKPPLQPVRIAGIVIPFPSPGDTASREKPLLPGSPVRSRARN